MLPHGRFQRILWLLAPSQARPYAMVKAFWHLWPLHHSIYCGSRTRMALNHGSTALELPYLHTRLCYRTAGSCVSYGSQHQVKHARTPWLSHFDASLLSTIEFSITQEPEGPLTMVPRLQNCHICTHNHAAAWSVPTRPMAPGTESSMPVCHG